MIIVEAVYGFLKQMLPILNHYFAEWEAIIEYIARNLCSFFFWRSRKSS